MASQLLGDGKWSAVQVQQGSGPGSDSAIQIEERRVNQVLTKVRLSAIGHSGARVLAYGPVLSVDMNNGLRPGRARDPD
jgi:hypothetical protein